MIFGIDLDGTYGADLPMFRTLVDVIKVAGHSCVMVTNRCEEDREVVEKLVMGQMPVLFACGKPKREVAEAAGYFVSIWIDDNPILVDLGDRGLAQVGVYTSGRRVE